MRAARYIAAAIGVGWLFLMPLRANAAGSMPGTGIDADFGARAARAAFVYRAQATQNATLKAMDDDLLDQRRRADALDGDLASVRSELQRTQSDAAGSRSRVAQLKLRVVQLGHDSAAAQDRFATALASKDADYARALATLRSAADDILATPDGLHVLELNNAGDWAGVKVIEAALRAARQKSREVAEAADARAFAVLALDNVEKGRENHAAVIERYQEVTRLDPSQFADWATLTSLYLEANDLKDARGAAAMAAQTAATSYEQIAAAQALGSVAAAGGDESGALDHDRAALAAARALAAADTTSLPAQRVLLAALIDLEEALETLQRHGEALAAQHEAYTIAVTLLRSGHSTNYDVRLFLQLAFGVTQRLLVLNRTDTALALATGAADLAAELARAQADDVGLQFDLATELTQVGDISAERGDVAAATTAYQKALDIDRSALARDPLFGAGRTLLLADLDRFAQLRANAGDLPAALALLRENLTVTRELVAADPGILESRFALALTLGHISAILLVQHDVAGAALATHEAQAILHALAPDGSGLEMLRGAISENLRQQASVAAAQGDQALALQDQRQATTLSAALLHDDSSSAIAIHEAISNRFALALLGASEASWPVVVAELEAFRKEGRLAPADMSMLADGRTHLAKDRP